MSKLLKALDYLFLTRPILFFPGWATLLAGYATVGNNHQLISRLRDGQFDVVFWDVQILIAMLSFTAAMGGCFILNQLQDIESDRRNNKLFLIGDGHVSRRAAWAEALLLLSLSMVASFLITPHFFVALSVFILITGVFYNHRPMSLKDKPFGGLAANMLMGWLAFALGRLTTEPFSVELLKLSLPYMLFNTALYFLTTLPDFQGDRASGKVTFPVRYGFVATIVVALLFYIGAAAVAVRESNEFMMIVCAVSLPFMMRLAALRSIAAVIVAVKTGIAAFALLMCFKFPGFLLLLAALFFLTRFYYRRRFAYDYPNFRGR